MVNTSKTTNYIEFMLGILTNEYMKIINQWMAITYDRDSSLDNSKTEAEDNEGKSHCRGQFIDMTTILPSFVASFQCIHRCIVLVFTRVSKSHELIEIYDWKANRMTILNVGSANERPSIRVHLIIFTFIYLLYCILLSSFYSKPFSFIFFHHFERFLFACVVCLCILR